MRRRTILSLITAALVIGPAVVSTLPAASAGPVTEYVESEYQVAHAPDGTPQTIVTENTVTATGELLKTTTTVSDNPRFRAAAESPFACAHTGHRSGFTQRDRREAIYKGRNDFAQFFFFPYSVDNARVSSTTGMVQKQWLICSTGGADADNGSRTVISGPGIAFKDGGATYKIGQIWKEGKTPGSYSVSLGFEVPTEAVKISGGITQTPTSALRGSPRPPFKSKIDAFSRNGSNGWWEADCAPDCVGTGGSNGFQGSVAEGLWEFPQGKPISENDFAMSGFHKHFCSNPFGCR